MDAIKLPFKIIVFIAQLHDRGGWGRRADDQKNGSSAGGGL